MHRRNKASVEEGINIMKKRQNRSRMPFLDNPYDSDHEHPERRESMLTANRLHDPGCGLFRPTPEDVARTARTLRNILRRTLRKQGIKPPTVPRKLLKAVLPVWGWTWVSVPGCVLRAIVETPLLPKPKARVRKRRR
jgi:hypothetical protein